MPVTVPIVAAYGVAGTDWLVLARLYVEDGTTHNLNFAVPADVSSITRTIVSLVDGTTVLNTTSLTVSAAVLSTPSSGTVWRAGGQFNVRDQIPGSLVVQEPGVEVRYVFTMAAGGVVALHVVLDLKPSTN